MKKLFILSVLFFMIIALISCEKAEIKPKVNKIEETQISDSVYKDNWNAPYIPSPCDLDPYVNYENICNCTAMTSKSGGQNLIQNMDVNFDGTVNVYDAKLLKLLYINYDQNGDGVLTNSEIFGWHEMAHPNYDYDQNGVINISDNVAVQNIYSSINMFDYTDHEVSCLDIACVQAFIIGYLDCPPLL